MSTKEKITDKENSAGQGKSAKDIILSFQELAEYLYISTKTLGRYVKLYLLECIVHPAGVKKFRNSHLDKWLDNHVVDEWKGAKNGPNS